VRFASFFSNLLVLRIQTHNTFNYPNMKRSFAILPLNHRPLFHWLQNSPQSSEPRGKLALLRKPYRKLLRQLPMRRRPSGPIEFTDVTAQAGIRFKASQRRLRAKSISGNNRPRLRLSRLRQRRLARHSAREFDGLAGTKERQAHARSLSQ